MSYSILKGPILAPSQYKYVSLIYDDELTGEVTQIAVIRTDIKEGINRLVDMDLHNIDSDQELFHFFFTYLSNFRAVPGVRIQGRAALIIAQKMADPRLAWSFDATMRIGTRTINAVSLREFDVRTFDINSANDCVLDLKAAQ